MSHASEDMDLDGRSVSPNLEDDAISEVMDEVRPYLINRDMEEGALKNQLHQLGADNIGRLRLLSKADMAGLMKPAYYEEWRSNIAKRTAARTEDTATDTYVFVIDTALSKNQLDLLKGTNILSGSVRTSIVQAIVEDWKAKRKGSLSDRYLMAFSKDLCSKYPAALCGIAEPDDYQLQLVTTKFADKLRCRFYYLQREKDKKRKRNDDDDDEADDDFAVDLPRFSIHEMYAIDPSLDMPSVLPVGETRDSLEMKRLEMVAMHTSGERVWATIRQYMKQCLGPLRLHIRSRIGIEALLEKWPFFGVASVLQSHFQHLKGISREAVREREKSELPTWRKFLEGWRHELKGKKHEQRRAAMNHLFRVAKDMSMDAPQNLILVFKGLLVYWKLDDESVMVYFDESSSRDDVESKEGLPSWPAIAVLGKDVMSEPRAYIIVGGRCINFDPVELKEAIHLLLETYYVLLCTYEIHIAPVMQFLEKTLYGIQDKGNRIERRTSKNGHKSHAIKEFCPRYLSVLQKIQEDRHDFSF